MSRERRTPRFLARFLTLAVALVAVGGSTGMARAEQPALITGEPVPAAELANMLYPVRTRGILMDEAKATPFAFLIQFEFDSANVKPESRPYLDEVGQMMKLKRLASRKIQIVGHADASGSERYNQRLSEERAQAISQYLARYHGIELERLQVAGRGESDPIDPSAPFAARNRRVQFHPAD